MNKKKIAGLSGLAAVLLVAAGFCLYKWMPSFRKANLNAYYNIEQEGDIALFYNTEPREEQVLVKNDCIYLPLEFAAELNCRFYWDEETAGIRYVLPEGYLYLFPGEAEYQLNGETIALEYAPLIEQDGSHFLELEWICAYTALEYQTYEEPDRLWLWDCYDTAVSYAMTEKKAKLRTLPTIKAPIVAQAAEGEPLLITEDAGDWYRVMSEDGQYGYVQKSALSEAAETVRSGEWFEKPVYPAKSLGETVILGWDYIDDISYGLDSLKSHLSRMSAVNVVSPTWFTLSDNSGGFTSRADQDYVELAHEQGLQVWALVENMNQEVDSLAIFSSCQARTKLIDGLMEQVQTCGIDGINLDMESLNEETAPHYLQFIRELSLRCREADVFLSVDNYVPMPYNAYYNLAEQGEIADYVIIMGYDQSWTEPGPNASLEFVQNAVENAMNLVRVDKLIQAVPFYARLWSENADGSWNRNSASMVRCEELLAECTDAEWLEEEGCYYGTVTVDDTVCQLWFEETESMEARLALLGQYELGGIAAWRLGLEDPAVWEQIQRYILR